LIALEVHQWRTRTLEARLDCRIGEQLSEQRCRLPLADSPAIHVNANPDAAPRRPDQSPHEWPIGQTIGGDVDVVLRPIDQRDIGLLQIFDRRIVNGRRGIGEAPQERDKH
jgi:hypothetical protein